MTQPDPDTSGLPRLSRSLLALHTAAPIRLLHIGLGNFHRAHQAWYTANAPDASAWGIAAFTGRRPDTANDLAPQDGLYTLITRSADGDAFEVIGSLAAVHPATDHQAYLDYLRRPEVAVITITVSEAGYVRGPDGHLDRGRDVITADAAALQASIDAPVGSLPGKLVAGLLARRAADAGPISILSCDNLPENGAVIEDCRHRPGRGGRSRLCLPGWKNTWTSPHQWWIASRQLRPQRTEARSRRLRATRTHRRCRPSPSPSG